VSPFAAVRLRTAAAKRFKKVENATAVIWKTPLIAEKTFRLLDAPELLAERLNTLHGETFWEITTDAACGEVYVNGMRAVNRRDTSAAA
jgi:heme oxygenase